MQPKRNTPPSGRRWRRRSVLTCSSMTIVDVVLARGTDAGSLRALRATCTTLRDALRDVTQFRLRERCAHVQRVLPKAGALMAITAVLADDEDAEDDKDEEDDENDEDDEDDDDDDDDEDDDVIKRDTVKGPAPVERSASPPY